MDRGRSGGHHFPHLASKFQGSRFRVNFSRRWMGPGWILGACCLLIGPIYLNLSLPRFGPFFSRSGAARELRGFSLGSSRNLWRVLWGHIKCRMDGWTTCRSRSLPFLPSAVFAFLLSIWPAGVRTPETERVEWWLRRKWRVEGEERSRRVDGGEVYSIWNE